MKMIAVLFIESKIFDWSGSRGATSQLDKKQQHEEELQQIKKLQDEAVAGLL
jgi:hypothetical protein